MCGFSLGSLLPPTVQRHASWVDWWLYNVTELWWWVDFCLGAALWWSGKHPECTLSLTDSRLSLVSCDSEWMDDGCCKYNRKFSQMRPLIKSVNLGMTADCPIFHLLRKRWGWMWLSMSPLFQLQFVVSNPPWRLQASFVRSACEYTLNPSSRSTAVSQSRPVTLLLSEVDDCKIRFTSVLLPTHRLQQLHLVFIPPSEKLFLENHMSVCAQTALICRSETPEQVSLHFYRITRQKAIHVIELFHHQEGFCFGGIQSRRHFTDQHYAFFSEESSYFA